LVDVLKNADGSNEFECARQRGLEFVRILILRLKTNERQKMQVMQTDQTVLGSGLIMAVGLIKRLHEPQNITKWCRISAIRKPRSITGDAFPFTIHGLFGINRPVYLNKGRCFKKNQCLEQIAWNPRWKGRQTQHFQMNRLMVGRERNSSRNTPFILQL
jgi:hypothetical protein